MYDASARMTATGHFAPCTTPELTEPSTTRADRAAPVATYDDHLGLFGHFDQRRHGG